MVCVSTHYGVGVCRTIPLCVSRVAKRKNPEMHGRIAAFEAKRADYAGLDES